jgi:hypothetical protein
MIAGILDIQQRSSRVHVRVRDNDHDVRVGRKRVNKSRESRISDLHSLELRLGFSTRQLELFDDVGYLMHETTKDYNE